MVRQTPRSVTRGLFLVVAGCALVHAGCLHHKDEVRPEPPKKPAVAPPKPGTPPSQVYSYWNKNVETGTDVVSNTTIAGISGRVYLLDEKGVFPLTGDGKVTVALYDDSARTEGGASKLLESWILDAETLKKLEQKDHLGTGYTMNLPWSTYRKDVRQIHMAVQYEPKTGTPITWTGTPMTVDHGQTQQVTHTTSGPVSPLGPVAVTH